ncbi:MAG: winged helix-turn-helix transcriptional regulator [Gemmatimonadetes bacterium]|nr:winged helix-turn-helix transcriptional regulator [Gemmatimonadota bacterium]
MEQKNQQNGARAKILRALANADCGLTTAELAESAGLTASQVRDNAGVAKKAGLLTIEQDEMTRFVTYNISQKGRDWLKSGKDDDAQAVADTGQDGEDHQAHYAPEDRIETESAPTGAWPRYSAYMIRGIGSPANQNIVADLDTATAMALNNDDEVIVPGLVEVGRTALRTVFVPA